MAAPRELSRPPITEALVDIRSIVANPIAAEQLDPLSDELRQTFPKVERKKLFHGEIRIEGGKALPATTRDLGFRGLWLQTDDGSRIV
jgi:hypothetical protein